MPLLVTNEPQSRARAPLRTLAATLVATFVFVVVLAVVARKTADEAGGVVRQAEPARGVDAGAFSDAAATADAGALVDARAATADAGTLVDGGALADAGSADAGEVVGPEPEPSAPADVAGPPVVPADVVAVTVPLVEECLQKALRFDPSLGGRARLRVVVHDGKLAPTVEPLSSGAQSPVLSSCVAAGSASLAWPSPAEGERHVVVARIVLDGLRKTVRVEGAELE